MIACASFLWIVTLAHRLFAVLLDLCVLLFFSPHLILGRFYIGLIVHRSRDHHFTTVPCICCANTEL